MQTLQTAASHTRVAQHTTFNQVALPNASMKKRKHPPRPLTQPPPPLPDLAPLPPPPLPDLAPFPPPPLPDLAPFPPPALPDLVPFPPPPRSSPLQASLHPSLLPNRSSQRARVSDSSESDSLGTT